MLTFEHTPPFKLVYIFLGCDDTANKIRTKRFEQNFTLFELCFVRSTFSFDFNVTYSTLKGQLHTANH